MFKCQNNFSCFKNSVNVNISDISWNPIPLLHLKINSRTIKKIFNGSSPALFWVLSNFSLKEIALMLFVAVTETIFEGQKSTFRT